jgi:hypothetical protein
MELCPLGHQRYSASLAVDALANLMLGVMEILVALDVLPPQAVAAVFVHARAMAQAGHLPAGVDGVVSRRGVLSASRPARLCAVSHP